MGIVSELGNAYATVEQADAVLKGWAVAHRVWKTLDAGLKARLLAAATSQIDTLPFRFPRAVAGQDRALPVLCNGTVTGQAEAELACILQAAHLIMEYGTEQAAQQDAEQGGPPFTGDSSTVCFAESADCIPYSLGALLVLEGLLDLTTVSVDEE
ncbi:hypothetical protein LN040_17085 [Desulfovibrio subterraneus]|uniref:hypothetical protein n=1 Tax=Desulfovibrio subterraneus TaxID=2718620 RepID=UPI0022B8B7E4|nr:hypothetical protein [Desulfovibrio subterraneus]WBF67397.1 hypothetical protein LN040_17085 [Desulfovibrio subterraneus]